MELIESKGAEKHIKLNNDRSIIEIDGKYNLIYIKGTYHLIRDSAKKSIREVASDNQT